ncbi:MAG: BREX protein BrxB domain-containing protein [Nannocystaceae bacterium]
MSQRLAEIFADLKRDLIHEDGPRISTMRNYRFCIAVYPPDREFDLRKHVQRLVSDMTTSGWAVTSISLQKLLLDRLRSHGDHFVEALIEREKLVAQRDPSRALNYLSQKITREIEGPDGIAADVAREIGKFVAQNADKADRTVAIIGRAGALYPFFRNSALLKHLDGKTPRGVPLVLLYPGERRGETGLSFMGLLNPDSDYRPRVYG